MRIFQLRSHLACCVLIWLGFALALSALNRFPLREDEAIYSYWALHGWRVDPFFLTVWPDKPPLFLGMLALAFQGWGASQASGRLLNIMLTLLSALVIGATARRLWGARSGLIATLLYLCNPFVLSFASTVYTDPMLVLAGQLALWLALTDRALGAGCWLAVAIMTKQQGLLYVPLIGAVLWTQPARPPAGQVRLHWQRWLRFGFGALLVLAPMIYWDSLRWAVAPSPWDLSVRNYGALQLLPPSTWLARSHAWAALLWYFTASWPVWLSLGVCCVILLHRSGKRFAATMQRTSVVWLLWGVGFLGLHIVTTVQLWDRYLLPLAPLFCLLAAGLFYQLATTFGPHASPSWVAAGGLLGLLLLAPPALTAARGGLPIGGDHGDYSGLTEVMAWLKTNAPAQVVLYHQQLGWHYQFYLYDELASGAYELRWFPSATYLAANAAQLPNRPRFWVQPDWAPQPDLPLQLRVRQMDLLPVARFARMTLYALQAQPHSTGARSCTWCLCTSRQRWPLWSDHALLRKFAQP